MSLSDRIFALLAKPAPDQSEEYQKHLREVVQELTRQGLVVSSGHLKHSLHRLADEGYLTGISPRNLKHKIKRVTPTLNEYLHEDEDLHNIQLKPALQAYAKRYLIETTKINPETIFEFERFEYRKDKSVRAALYQHVHYYQEEEDLHAFLKSRTTVKYKLLGKNNAPQARVKTIFQADKDITG